MTPNVPLLSWTPDGDLTRPGAVADVENMVPTARGYASHPGMAWADQPTTALPAACVSSGFAQFSGGLTPIGFYGTASNIYAAVVGFTDLTRVSPAYTPVTNSFQGWRFAGYKSIALVCSYLNTLQESSSPGTGVKFTDVSGAPSAASMCVQSGFVMLSTFPDTGAWPYYDGWWCSALNDHTDWTPDLATGCDRGRLTATPGGVVRVVAFQDDVIAFKGTSVYRGTYVNQPESGIIWEWTVLSTGVGLVAHDAVCEAEGQLYWLGFDGFYRFNGAQIARISSAPWEWFNNNSNDLFAPEPSPIAVYDPAWRVVKWHYDSGYDNSLDSALAYHIDTDRWGKFDAAIEHVCPSHYTSTRSPITGELGYRRGIPRAIESGTHLLVSWWGDEPDSSITTGDFGDDDNVTVLTKARLRCYRAPTSAAATHYYRQTLDDALTTGGTSSRVDGKYDFSQGARWHRIKFSGAESYEVAGFSFTPPPGGKR